MSSARGEYRKGNTVLAHIGRFPFFTLTLALLLVGCSGGSHPEAAQSEAEAIEEFVPVISATGEVVPVRWALLGAPASGIVAELLVDRGDRVQAGDPLVRLGDRQAAEAALAAARLELVTAQQAREDLQAEAEVQATQAQLELANARDALEDAEYKWRVQQQGNRASPEAVRAAEARLLLAEEALDEAKDDYDEFSGAPSDDPRRAAALVNWENARVERDSALRNLNWYKGHPTEVQQAVLDAEVAVAEARVADAEREWQKRQGGPAPDELALAEARLANAQAQVAAAEAALANLEIQASFAGTVSEVYIRDSEWVSMGAPVLLLADLAGLQVETTDLSELDVARIEVGDPVTVTFDALPETVVAGTVASIAPKASEGAGVNYTVVVELAEIPAGLRWEMTAFVDVQVQPEG
jgi:multidrug efflux pump subunit AcrA (membrane-fusion protein)